MSVSMLTREVAYLLVDEGYTPKEVSDHFDQQVAYHIKKLLNMKIIEPWSRYTLKNYSYSAGPNYHEITTYEYCPHCEKEVRILQGKISRCPECEAWIVPCSSCDLDHKCSECGMSRRSGELNDSEGRRAIPSSSDAAISPGFPSGENPFPREETASPPRGLTLDGVTTALRAVRDDLKHIEENIVACDQLDSAMGTLDRVLGILEGES